MQNLSRHLKEAIAINTHRMPLYGELSNGASIPYSKRLIRYEKLLLLSAWFFDRKGDMLQEHGIPYLKAEFVEMSLTPEFSTTYPADINFTQALKKVDISSFSSTIKDLIAGSNYTALVDTCEDLLEHLKQQKHVYCMLRHLVESLGRIAYLIPLHQEKCAEKSIKDPTAYSHYLLKSHYWALGKAIQFDEAIEPIQTQGIPLLYQDLPPIEMRADYE